MTTDMTAPATKMDIKNLIDQMQEWQNNSERKSNESEKNSEKKWNKWSKNSEQRFNEWNKNSEKRWGKWKKDFEHMLEQRFEVWDQTIAQWMSNSDERMDRGIKEMNLIAAAALEHVQAGVQVINLEKIKDHDDRIVHLEVITGVRE